VASSGEQGGAGDVRPFESHDDLLVSAAELFRARGATDAKDALVDEAQAAAATELWHARFEATGDELVVCARCAALSKVEREVVVAMLLGRLMLVDSAADRAADILKVMGAGQTGTLPALRALSEEGRLYAERIISYDDVDDELADRRIALDPVLVEFVLHERGAAKGWDVQDEGQLRGKLASLTRALQRKSGAFEHIGNPFYRGGSDVFKACRRVDRLLRLLQGTLELHPQWRLAKWIATDLPPSGFTTEIIVLALLGKELGHVAADDRLFTGGGLARAASHEPEDVLRNIDLVGPHSGLVRRGAIQPCGGSDVLLSDDPEQLAEVEFELTDEALEALGLERRLVKKRSGRMNVREAEIRLSQLVLADEVRHALQMAIAQVRHTDVLLDHWGFRETIPYGRGVTILFAGPPGVGKTACAEALAHELKKPILVADYSELEDCFVGQTEKNIVRIFAQARAHDAVLFWDEADAMFAERDRAIRAWEVRDVNVLLQEIERFSGVCILATNRKVALDAALERRISLKVEFERPDREMRREIWAILVPPGMPLAEDVELEELLAHDLSGGEIKNVVLNAARSALARGSDSKVGMDDFRQAVRGELDGALRKGGGSPIGFRQ
jgi:AAA+ superfamily predicted ATPase